MTNLLQTSLGAELNNFLKAAAAGSTIESLAAADALRGELLELAVSKNTNTAVVLMAFASGLLKAIAYADEHSPMMDLHEN